MPVVLKVCEKVPLAIFPESQPCAAPQLLNVPSLQAVEECSAPPTQFHVTVSPAAMRVGQTMLEKEGLQNQKSPTLTVVVAALTSPLPACATTASMIATTASLMVRRNVANKSMDALQQPASA